MARPASPAIALSDLQRKTLQVLLKKHRLPQQLAKRISVILHSDSGKSNTKICELVKMTRATVLSRKGRWLSFQQSLEKQEALLEAGRISAKEYESALLASFEDLPRPGAPKRITLAQEQKIVALAASHPGDYGIPINGWTIRMLAQVAVSQNIIASISAAQVDRILKKSALKSA